MTATKPTRVVLKTTVAVLGLLPAAFGFRGAPWEMATVLSLLLLFAALASRGYRVPRLLLALMLGGIGLRSTLATLVILFEPGGSGLPSSDPFLAAALLAGGTGLLAVAYASPRGEQSSKR